MIRRPEPRDLMLSDTSRKSIAELTEATNKTFEGYFVPVHHTPEGFARFCRLCHIDIAQSVWLQDKARRLVGLAMLAIRQDRAWCGGFGIAPEFRRQGLAAHLIEGLIVRAQGLRLRTLQLEVLAENEPAIRTYRRAGFQVTREFVLLGAPIAEVLPHLITLPESTFEITSIASERLLYNAVPWETQALEQRPCWQRECATLMAQSELRGLVARQNSVLRAALLYRLNRPSGQITVDSLTFHDPDAAKALLATAAAEAMASAREITPSQPPGFYILNEPEDSALYTLLREVGWKEQRRQHEMIRHLTP